MFGCISRVQTGEGKKEIILIPTSLEVAIGKDASKDIEKQLKVLNDHTVTAYVNEVGQKIVNVCFRRDINYHFKVIDAKDINAFALPGGFIYIYAGALANMESEAELASVLAHEIAHVAARHGVKQIQRSTAFKAVAGIVLKDQAKVVKQLSGVAANLVFLGYSREAEFEADDMAVKFTYKADYDPQGIIDFFKLIESQSKGESRLTLILRTHPLTNDRIARCQKTITAIKKKTDLKTEKDIFKEKTKKLSKYKLK